MDRKNKAARAVNVALGLIVIMAVVLFSPLFGFAGGSPEEGRAESAQRTDAAPVQAAAATPRPTPKPTPTPVVLPSAPPTPEPTPQPVRTPAPQVQTVPQAQQQWAPVQNPQEDYGEYEEYEEYGEEDGGEPAWEQSEDIGGVITQNDNGDEIIANDNFDLIFQDSSNVSVAQWENTEPAADQGGGYVFSPEANEGVVIAIG